MNTKITTITAKQKLVPESVAISHHLFVVSGEINCKNKRDSHNLTQYCIVFHHSVSYDVTSRYVISGQVKPSKSRYFIAPYATSGHVMACHMKSSQVE